MAAKPLRIFLIIVILTAAGIVLTKVVESRLSLAQKRDQDNFIATYIEMEIARERYFDADSLARAIDDIYRAHGVDSAWMADYAVKMSGNLVRSGLIWENIVGKLDSIRQVAPPETTATSPPRP